MVRISMLTWSSNRLKRVIAAIVIMIAVISVIVFALVSSTTSAEVPKALSQNTGDEQLKMLHLFFRHGQRTPADTYPNDPYLNHTFSPFGWGQLTNVGKKQLYDLGLWARDRYDQFLGSTFSPDYVHAQSTGVSRTQMSIALVLAALFQPRGTPLEWNKDLNWQPVPFTYEPLDQDTLLLVRTTCPRYYEALDEVFKLPEVKALLDANRELFEELTKITGMDIKTPDDIQSLYSTLKAEQEFGVKLPEWTERYYPQRLQNLTEESYVLNVYTDELKRIKGGPFLAKTLNEWKNIAQGKKEKKIFVYAGHDSTVVNILSAFNVWKPQFPDYATAGFLELYQNARTGVWSVSIMSKRVGQAPEVLTIPGCDSLCALEKLETLLSNHLPGSGLVKECKAKDENATVPPASGP